MAGERKGRDPYIPKDLAQRHGSREKQHTLWSGGPYEDLLRISSGFTERFATQLSGRYNAEDQHQLYVAGNMYKRLHTSAALQSILETERIPHVLRKIETFEGMTEFGLELLGSTDFDDKAAGAGMIYLLSQRPEFSGETQQHIVRQAIHLFGLPKETFGMWAFDGNNSNPELHLAPEDIQNINLRALCELEMERPGAGETLWKSPFRIINFGRYPHQHLIDQYDAYLEMIDPQRKKMEIPKGGISIIGVGENDWNGSGYLKLDGQTHSGVLVDFFESYAHFNAKPFIVEFSRVSHLVDVISFLANVYGLPQDGKYGDFIMAVGISSHGAKDRIAPARPEVGLRRRITVDTLSRYPEKLLRIAEQIGIKTVIITGCESGLEGGFVQSVSDKIRGPLVIGSRKIDSLSSAWIEENSGLIRVEFAGQEHPPTYKDGQRVDYYG